ncbi:hypothetical protein [Pseudochryseolinea flava]|uniref:Lipoprotein n=1 Tax=Pseudochryseolinea flava TaxID=2059302 RepID=A0A364XXC6_9BACT|nr:hypothetical protein [Pseudochryseolinea flava]RAV98420.1 hypothetical protein DQQ10_24145 [Pseudochryseolinea flava]
MKKVLLAVLVITLMASCDVYYVEPRYDHRDQITGYYDVEDYSRTYDEFHYYGVTITKVGSYGSSEIMLRDLYADGIEVYAYYNGNSIDIPFQIVDGYEIEGSGSLSHGVLDLHYRAKDRHIGVNDFCELFSE